jgi:hypothetical protein
MENHYQERVYYYESVKAHFSNHAALAALCRKVKRNKVFEPIVQKERLQTINYSTVSVSLVR